jgi:hypothetical protein
MAQGPSLGDAAVAKRNRQEAPPRKRSLANTAVYRHFLTVRGQPSQLSRLGVVKVPSLLDILCLPSCPDRNVFVFSTVGGRGERGYCSANIVGEEAGVDEFSERLLYGNASRRSVGKSTGTSAISFSDFFREDWRPTMVGYPAVGRLVKLKLVDKMRVRYWGGR